MVATNTFAFRLPTISMTLCLISGLLIFVLGNWQTRQLAETESDRLGQTLAAQAVEGVRQYTLHNDRVSMQVYVDHLVKRDAIASATIYNEQQRQLARSGTNASSPNMELKNYREPLLIEGKTTAYAAVDINISALLARYRKPLHWILTIWAIFTAVVIIASYLAGRLLSKRLSNLAQRLPGEELLSHCRNELELLELRLQPLLTHNSDAKPAPNPEPESKLQIATMALHCKNLVRLEQQLSKDKFQRLLNKLDDDLDQIAALYDGQRRPGRDQTLFIEFNGDTESGDHPMRALFCAHVLLELAECYARSQGVAMELSAAVKLSSEESSNALLNDFEREKRETEVARLAQQGKRGETLLDSATSLHHTLTDILTTQEVSESSDLHKVASFTSAHQTLLEKQLRYLVEHPDNTINR